MKLFKSGTFFDGGFVLFLIIAAIWGKGVYTLEQASGS